MIIEMRTYKTKPGCRSKFLQIFQSDSIPAHAEIGMKILGPFLSRTRTTTPSFSCAAFPTPVPAIP